MSKAVWEKLGMLVEKDIILINPPENYWQLIDWNYDEFPTKVASDADIIHFFTNNLEDLVTQIPRLKKLIKPNGGIWISHFKKSSGRKTSITSSTLRQTVHTFGLTDNKVCSIDEDWTACRFVIPIKDR